MGVDGPGRGHLCHTDTFLVPSVLGTNQKGQGGEGVGVAGGRGGEGGGAG